MQLKVLNKSQRKNWLIWLAFLLALLGVANFAFGRISLFPPSEGQLINYWPIIFYSRNVWLISSALVPISLFGAVVLIDWQIKARGLIASLGLLVVGLCAYLTWGFLMIDTFEHFDTVRRHEKVYHVGQTIDIDGFAEYALCECERLGLFCRCHYFYWNWLTAIDEIRPPKLSVDPATNAIIVQSTDLQLTYFYGPTPHCNANPDLGRCKDGQ